MYSCAPPHLPTLRRSLALWRERFAPLPHHEPVHHEPVHHEPVHHEPGAGCFASQPLPSAVLAACPSRVPRVSLICPMCPSQRCIGCDSSQDRRNHRAGDGRPQATGQCLTRPPLSLALAKPHSHGPHSHGPHSHGPHSHGPHLSTLDDQISCPAQVPSLSPNQTSCPHLWNQTSCPHLWFWCCRLVGPPPCWQIATLRMRMEQELVRLEAM